MKTLLAFTASLAIALTAVAGDLSEHSTLSLLMELESRGLPSYGCPGMSPLTATWTSPTEGGPVELYTWEILIRGAAVDTTVIVTPPTGTMEIIARVRGENDAGPGPWSLPGCWPDSCASDDTMGVWFHD